MNFVEGIRVRIIFFTIFKINIPKENDKNRERLCRRLVE